MYIREAAVFDWKDFDNGSESGANGEVSGKCGVYCCAAGILECILYSEVVNLV